MKTKTLLKALGSALLLLGLSTASTPFVQAQGRVVKRDLQEWLDAQGTLPAPRPGLPNTPRLFGFVNNPDINGDGVAEGPAYFLWWDYAGVLSRPGTTGYVDADNNLGPTSITGTVTERAIGNGLADVTVALNVTDALIWVIKFDGVSPVGTVGDVVFGARETELEANPNLVPARATAQLTLRFTNPVGAALPDLRTPGLDWYGDTLVLHAEGPLTAAFDPDVEAGTPGKLRWGKPYITPPASEDASNGAYSQFPNDEFHLFPIGPR
jgi:hypothetical protein